MVDDITIVIAFLNVGGSQHHEAGESSNSGVVPAAIPKSNV